MIRQVGEDHQLTESVGERLRRLRLERGLSQRDLSAPGVSYAYISRIEAGARRPSVKALRLLARKLGVTPEYLETGSQIADAEARELRLADLELRLRLDGEPSTAELAQLLAEAVDPYTRVRLYWSLGRISGEQADSRGALESFRRAVALLEATDDTLHLARAHMACAEAAISAGEPAAAAAPHLANAERLLGPR